MQTFKLCHTQNEASLLSRTLSLGKQKEYKITNRKQDVIKYWGGFIETKESAHTLHKTKHTIKLLNSLSICLFVHIKICTARPG
jgi:hypothetical protein